MELVFHPLQRALLLAGSNRQLAARIRARRDVRRAVLTERRVMRRDLGMEYHSAPLAEVGHGPMAGWFTRKRYRYSRKARVRSPTSSRPKRTKARFEVLSAEDGSLTHWSVPVTDQEQTHHQVLVAQLQDPDPGEPLQVLPPLEGPAEEPVS
jgi:hypothetical protein